MQCTVYLYAYVYVYKRRCLIKIIWRLWRQKLENAVAVVAINTHQGALQSGLR